MRVYAHRGASSECPENTLRSFRRALELGVFGVELDVHLSSDGIPVVIHDPTVDRTTNGRGAVADMTLEELQGLDAGDGERIPSLDSVLDLVGDSLFVDIEVKAATAANAVIKEAGGRAGLKWAMSSFDHDVLRTARAWSAEIELWPLVVMADDVALATAKDLRSSMLAVSNRTLTGHVAQRIRAAGMGLWVWTVNDPERAIELRSWQVSGLCTDNPRLIREALGSR